MCAKKLDLYWVCPEDQFKLPSGENRAVQVQPAAFFRFCLKPDQRAYWNIKKLQRT
jgi:hypothetical protein